jgi:hypothetical protein
MLFFIVFFFRFSTGKGLGGFDDNFGSRVREHTDRRHAYKKKNKVPLIKGE